MPLQLLELFKGTGSVGKVAEKMGFKSLSVDFDKKFKPDIETDILDWDYKKFYNDTKYTPDFIWASPPCNTFSVLAYQFKERDTKTAEPFSKRAKIGTAILYRTLNIIAFFKSKNKNMGYCIENPRGMMRHDKKMKKLRMETTIYCLYGDNRRKPTNFWSNYPLNLRPIEDEKKTNECDNPVSVAHICVRERYKIPSKLVRHILKQYLKI